MQSILKLILIWAATIFALSTEAQALAEALSKNPKLIGSLLSVQVSDIETGESLSSLNPDQRLCPASVWKLFTTGAALKILGADFRFRTVLAYQGSISDGTLTGDIYLIGGGDPSLGSRFFNTDLEATLTTWSAAIKAAGIDSIAGNIIANSTHFQGDGMPRTRIWEDMGNYYGSAVSGLNIHDNTYFLEFMVPRETGLLAEVASVYPEVPDLTIESEVTASTVQVDRAFIFGSPESNTRMVRGTLPAGRGSYTIKGSLPNPPLFAAHHLAQACAKNGIKISGSYKVEADVVREPATLKILLESQSPPLSTLVKHTNVNSDNLFAETLLFQLGVKAGDPTLQGGLDELNRFYNGICQSAYPFFGYDGSGLSRFTAVSSAQITSVLSYFKKDEMVNKYLLQQLPLAGKEGSMKTFGRGTDLAGNLRAKSGSMERVKAYAGTFQARSGRVVSFAFLVNNFDGNPNGIRTEIEAFLSAIQLEY